jgi:serine/threonine-protein kinase
VDISVSDASVGRLLDGRYRVETLLARGGMATVYKAVDTRLDRVVAVKVMHAELAADDDFVARFIGEARAVAQLSDPNVVNVFDQGEDHGVVFLAMEYIEGRTLRDVLRERGRLGAALALEVAESVLSALAAAHRAGIVHRDVKPENVLVGNNGRVKVADFGLARALSSSYKTTRGLLGTVTYISPEQALGEKATPRSDVYSVGIMLFELLTGRPPHDGPTDFVVVRSHIDDDVPPPSGVVPVPRAVDDLVVTATSRSPADRYADADDFLAALRTTRTSIGGYPPDSDDTDIAQGPELSVESRDSAGVTVDEALADLVASNHRELAAQDAVVDSPPPPPPPTAAKTKVIDASPGDRDDEEPTEATPATSHSRDHGRRRGRRGLVMFVLVLLLAVGVSVTAWWYGSGRWGSVPSLLNMTPEQAQAAAQKAGFTTTAGDKEFSEAVQAGLILRTTPGPGERLLNGGEIVFVVSKGPERYEVPQLANMTLDQARQAVSAVSLGVRVADEVYHEHIAKGHVISQDVAPGEKVRRGTEVSLVVSLGRQPIEIQDFTGRDGDEAAQALSDAGFTVNSSQDFSTSVEAGLVISQDPAGGTGFKGDKIDLVISQGPQLIHVPDVVGERVDKATSKLEEAGFKVDVVDLLPEIPSGREPHVIRMEPSGGEHPPGTTITIYHF